MKGIISRKFAGWKFKKYWSCHHLSGTLGSFDLHPKLHPPRGFHPPQPKSPRQNPPQQETKALHKASWVTFAFHCHVHPWHKDRNKPQTPKGSTTTPTPNKCLCSYINPSKLVRIYWYTLKNYPNLCKKNTNGKFHPKFGWYLSPASLESPPFKKGWPSMTYPTAEKTGSLQLWKNKITTPGEKMVRFPSPQTPGRFKKIQKKPCWCLDFVRKFFGSVPTRKHFQKNPGHGPKTSLNFVPLCRCAK